jgi:PAS domain-containing protein
VHDFLVSEGVPSRLFTDGWAPDPRETTRARRATDLLFAAVAILYPAWHWVFRALMTSPRDSLGERLLVAAASLLAMLLSRLRAFTRAMPAVEQVVLALLTGHYLSLVWRNDFAFPYVAGLYVLFASVGTVISRLGVAITYSAIAMASLTVMSLMRQRSSADLEVLLGLATLLVAICVGVYRTTVTRRMVMQRLLRERQLMKQIIETIPDPVFVRNAERELVLTNEAGRQFDNATGYDTEPIVQQELITLAGGQALTQDSAVTTRFGQIAMSVKTARAESVNHQVMVVTVMRDVTDRRKLEDSLRSKIRELEKAKDRVRQLQGMLPICMHCSRIRTESDEWQALEKYVAGHSEASFTHTLCASCLEQHYPEEGVS